MSIFIIALLFLCTTLISCKEYVPVLMWSSQPSLHPFTSVSAFAKITPNEFTDYMLKKVKIEKPTILVFLEDNLSVEDFSWNDESGGAYPNLKNISKAADDFGFLPSVHNPSMGLTNLLSHGYSWRRYNETDFESPNSLNKHIYGFKFNTPDLLYERSKILKKHDKQIAKIYKHAMIHNRNILAVYTGKHNSWSKNEIVRHKREAAETNNTGDLIITDDKNIVRMSLTPPIIYHSKEQDKGTTVNITKVVGTPTTHTEKDKISMTVRFGFEKDKDVSVKFDFMSVDNEWWSLDNAEIANLKQKNLVPSVPVSAPPDYSYFCNPTVVLSNGKVSLTFQNFQVQPKVGKGNSFGPVMHCIPYFSIAIWSGLVIVAILSIVLAWGIVMIMDINTNDRFDDPKGKTITITATD